MKIQQRKKEVIQSQRHNKQIIQKIERIKTATLSPNQRQWIMVSIVVWTKFAVRRFTEAAIISIFFDIRKISRLNYAIAPWCRCVALSHIVDRILYKNTRTLRLVHSLLFRLWEMAKENIVRSFACHRWICAEFVIRLFIFLFAHLLLLLLVFCSTSQWYSFHHTLCTCSGS